MSDSTAHSNAGPGPGSNHQEIVTTTGAPAAKKRTLRRIAMTLAPFTGLVLFFGVWEAYVRLADLRRAILPTPSSIFVHVYQEPAFYWRNGRVTVSEAWWGFVAALIVAIVIATFMAHSRFIEKATFPVIVMIQSTPVAVLAPVFLIWFGFGAPPKILMSALFAFVPFVTNAYTGLRAVDPAAFELLESVNASRWEVFWRLRFPHALPYLFSAARICVGLALVGAVIGEFLGGSTEGLGNAVRIGQTRLLIDQLWGGIFVLALIGISATLVLGAAERRILSWHSTQLLVD